MIDILNGNNMRYKLVVKHADDTTVGTVVDKIKSVLSGATASRALGAGLGGAAIGAGISGVVSRGMRPGETPDEYKRRLRDAIVIGGLLGGTGGAGASLAMPTITGVPVIESAPPTNESGAPKLTPSHIGVPAAAAAATAAHSLSVNPPSEVNIQAHLNKLKKRGPLQQELIDIRQLSPWRRPWRRAAFSLRHGGPMTRAIGRGAAAAIIAAAARAILDRSVGYIRPAVAEH